MNKDSYIGQVKNSYQKSKPHVHYINYQMSSITLSRSTASTASLAKCSLSCERIFELKVVLAIFIKSDLNFSAKSRNFILKYTTPSRTRV